MLDEIDCIALKRDGQGGSDGELARTTISLMQEMDQLTNEQIVIGATNRADRVDPAVKRRFFQKYEIWKFGYRERFAMATKFLDDVGVSYNSDKVRDFCKEEKTQAEIIQFATQIVIEKVVNGWEKK